MTAVKLTSSTYGEEKRHGTREKSWLNAEFRQYLNVNIYSEKANPQNTANKKAQ